MIRRLDKSTGSTYLIILFGSLAAILVGLTVAHLDASRSSAASSSTPRLWIAIIVSTILVCVATTLVSRYLKFTFWSPVYGFVAVYTILGGVGYIYYRTSSSYLGTFYDISVSDPELTQAFLGFLLAIVAFLFGALAYVSLIKHFSHLSNVLGRGLKGNNRRSIPTYLTSRTFNAIHLVPLLIPLLIFIIGKGPGNIWYRNEYLVEQYHFVYVVGSLVSLPVLFMLGYMLPAKKSMLWQIFCLTLFVLYEILFLSASSRRFVVGPLFFMVGLSLGKVKRRTIVILVSIWVIMLPLLSTVPLELRGMYEQGIAPLPSNLTEIFAQDADESYISAADTLVQNVAFSVPLAGYVGSTQPIPAEYLLVGINPLPSFVPIPSLPSWGDIQEQFLVEQHMPYSALGELLNHGWTLLILYYAFVGGVAAWAHVGSRASMGHRSRWGFLVACGMLDFFAITSTQYNLRSATRFICYAILVAVLWKLLCRIDIRLRNRYFREISINRSKRDNAP